MTLGYEELRAVTQELARVLEGCTFVGSSQVDRYRVLLEFERPDGVGKKVLVCTEVHLARLHLTEGQFASSKPNAFVKQLNGIRDSVLSGLEVLYRDRVVNFSLIQGRERYNLLFECSGHHPNLYLLDAHFRILGFLNPPTSKKRRLEMGTPYQKPLPHEGSEIVQMRFVDHGLGLSTKVEAWYAEEEERVTRVRKTAEARRELKAALFRLEELANDLDRDLAKQRRAAETLSRGAVSDGKRERFSRLSQALPGTRRRRQVVEREVERLKRILADLRYDNLEESLAAAKRALARCGRGRPRGRR